MYCIAKSDDPDLIFKIDEIVGIKTFGTRLN